MPAPRVTAQDSEWYPYPNRMMFLLDTLDNLPRLRVSSSLMRVFLWVLKEAGCKDVPSFDRLRKVQKDIRSQCGIPSIPCRSVQGNIFFMNDPRTIIAQDWSNPATRKLIRVYPEIPEDGIIREFWHAQKWHKTMDLDTLSPILVIPVRWVTFRGKVYADAYAVELDSQGEATVVDTETIFVCTDALSENYHDLEHAAVDAGYLDSMPNPKRKIAAGRPMYNSFVNYFSNDVSGNRTKSWNKHWNVYMTHENLPRELHQQEFHVHFVSTSPNATASEQFQEFKTAAEATHTDPVEVRDEVGNTSCFCLYVNVGASDNPMQSEVACHIGRQGNYFCRKCNAGGTRQEKATDEGYHALFESGAPRTKEQILEELEKQVRLACCGVAKPVQNCQKATGVKDVYTQFWIDQLLSRFKEMRKDKARSADDIKKELIQWTIDNRFDPAKDTPIEILHTILLGVVKYVWHITPHRLATNVDGLSIHAIRSSYIMQYAGSLIGRQFKTLVQTNIFHIQSLVGDMKFKAWKAVGELSALLWVPEIRNLVEYQRDLKVAVGNVLDICAIIDPSKIISKIKYHLLVHAPYDAALRDIARQLGDQEGFKHRITGGWWSLGNGEWTRAGSGVRRFMAQHPILQKLVGWTEKERVEHGTVSHSIAKLQFRSCVRRRETVLLKSTTARSALNFGEYKPDSAWTKCLRVISESLDECLVESWVFAKGSSSDAPKITGRISDILVDPAGVVLVVLERFQVLKERDELYGMPVLVRRDGETTFCIVPAQPQAIMFKFNVQHDCGSAKCEATGVRSRMQERVESGQIDHFIIHKPLDRFFINTHAFHNAHLLRTTLPRDLIAPIPLFADRQVKHHELATELREQHAKKKRKRAEEDGGDEGDEKRRKVTKKAKARGRKPANPKLLLHLHGLGRQ
ncbi:hypothetical protein B0H14DRAFT_3718234 [Mycena olivaceomarginata]|nr:hypothetical protein B0H14DRAFT_3718234 [Mycena olivaceomarginata]